MAQNITFYHVSQRLLRIGTTLTIGTYGERIRRRDFVEQNYASYIKEEIFEDVRQHFYPESPSRMNCVFLFPEFSIAREFYANTCGYRYYVYEVEVKTGQPFVAEMDLIRCDSMRYEDITSKAHKYWKQVQHPNSGTLEVLLNGQATVTKIVLEPSKI